MGAAVDARGANFSDSISTKRQAYRTREKSQRRRRRREDGTEDVGDLSDSEDESLERRLARLRREVEDLKLQMENRAGSGHDGTSTSLDAGQTAHHHAADGEEPGEAASLGDGVAELSRALDNLHASSRVNRSGSHYSAANFLTQKLGTSLPGAQTPKQGSSSTGETAASAVTPVSSQTTTAAAPLSQSSLSDAATAGGLLSHAAAFEGRLALLETSMGISSSSNPFVGDGFSEPTLQPVLPTLEQMATRLSTLTSLLVGSHHPASGGSNSNAAIMASTTPNLEALSTRIRKLTADADALASSRKRAADAAKAAQAARLSSGADGDAAPATTADASSAVDDDQLAKIHALYTTLPTIQSLHPLLPSVLERLRSLRACHAGAAHAAESLNELEKRQAEMATEIEQWREGLVAVEERMKQGEGALRSNVETVEPWVRDLEARMARLEGPPGGF